MMMIQRKFDFLPAVLTGCLMGMLLFFNLSAPVLAQNFLQRMEIPSSPNPVGSGARALGMGGAFIGVADDATAASWNPGGLIQLERPEISMVLNTFHRIEDNSFDIYPDAGGVQTVEKFSLNYFSAAYPFQLFGKNMIASLNYQSLYDFTRKWDFPLVSDSNQLMIRQNVDYWQDGKLTALGLAYAIEMTPWISAGFSLNLWKDGLGENQWEQKIFQMGSGSDAGDVFRFETGSRDKYSFSGINANIGVMWNITQKLSLGMVVKLPFEADLEHEHSGYALWEYPEIQGYSEENATEYKADEILDMPLSFGFGASYRFSKSFSISADICRTEWDDFIHTDADGRQTSPITGQSPDESDISPTHQVRIGAEYLFIVPQKYVIPVRTGLFYDPAPAQGSPDNIFGFTIGSGIGWKRFIFDIAYQYRFGNNIGKSVLKEWGFSQDIREHALFSSLIIHF